MYRVLIVDDEEPVLESFSMLLEKESPAFAVAGKARTGYEALRLIHELRPDVVFMDINIPGIDGIKVIEEVHLVVPETVFILSTAYERFDLAQRALPLGVFAYLVKPISRKIFQQTLDAVRHHLEKRQNQGMQKNINLLERQFMSEIIWKPMKEEEWEHYKELFSLVSEKGFVGIVEIEKSANEIGEKIIQKLLIHHRCLFIIQTHRLVFLVPESVDLALFKREFIRILEELEVDSLLMYGIGNVYSGPEIYKSCAEALEEIRKNKKNKDVFMKERIKFLEIRRKIGIAPLEEIQGLVSDLWVEINSAYPFDVAKAKIASFFTLLIDDCSSVFKGQEDIVVPFFPVEEIMKIQDDREWYQWSALSVPKLYHCFSLNRKVHFPLPLVKALNYINEHFTEPLQLSSVAEEVQVSPAYLSRLFSDFLQSNFVDYVTQLRMDRAETLLKTTALSIKEIAFQVGYQDPNYFSKIFKKIKGVSPSTFGREEQENKQNVE
ncbi:helix-turn-helix domain-containing protein [Treponema sp. J25]|uniref:response regulator transcription factor n=1 Tax=Treponema sp. J25 TaxID=2094121 RepID=UPI00104CF192|nr:helix-turn-helix domain-containing protein [Treponema sp. J25]MCX7656384.1 helix-turn-helix domain-containing protein [Treponemataceae bacterium]TCW61759.1 DNA-binding response regulator [Treponema sp. J25]